MFEAKSDKFWLQRSGAGRTKWLIGLMQVGSRFGQDTSPGHGGQVHVRTRPLGRAKFSSTSCGSCGSTWSGKCLLNRGDGPGWINVRTNWAYRPEGQESLVSSLCWTMNNVGGPRRDRHWWEHCWCSRNRCTLVWPCEREIWRSWDSTGKSSREHR